MLLISACLNCGLFAISALAQGTVFTYQGRLDEAGYPVTGIYDFRFRLASDPLGTNYLGGASVATNVPVANGLFTVALDFGGGIFNGNSYWLGVEVRTGIHATNLSDQGLQVGNEFIPCRVKIWAAGNTASFVGKSLGVTQHRPTVPMIVMRTSPGNTSKRRNLWNFS